MWARTPLRRHRERGISPVIGVVILVAITVLLVAIGGVFFLNLTDNPTPAPESSFEFEYDEDTNEVTVTVEAGGPFTDTNTDQLVVVVDSGNGNRRAVWADSGGSVVDLTSGKLSSGQSITIDDDAGSDTGDKTLSFELEAGDEISVVWLSPDDDTTARLASDTVPSLEEDAVAPFDQPGGITTVDDGAAGDGGASVGVGPGSAEVLGNTGDIDGDGRTELPYVDSSGNLQVNDSSGQTETLVDASSVSQGDPETTNSLMATGTWNGSDTAVFYADDSRNAIYRVSPGGSPTEVTSGDGSSNGIQSVLGFGDIDGDGTDELVFADDSQNVQYLDPDGTKSGNIFTSTGNNNGIGNGPLPDPDGDGTDEAVVVTGSNEVALVDTGGLDATLTSGGAAKSPATAADVDDDGSLEIVFVDASETVKYVDDVSGSNTEKPLEDEDGNAVTADDETGVVS